MIEFIFVLIAYLLGSIPTSVWVGKAFYDIDIRKYGSKNAGATNTFRVLGKAAGSFVFMVDVGKGFLAVWLMHEMIEETNSWLHSTYKILAAVAAIMGHVFPIFAGFKGGKGVATAFGILLALTPLAAAICFVIFLLIWLAVNFVSLGSIVAAFCYPLIQYFLEPEQDEIMFIFSILLSLTVIFSHRQNIIRLIHGVETKTYAFRSKKKKNR
jgi:acyl phosphate:glycerol-3-phosphate acyltransferase